VESKKPRSNEGGAGNEDRGRKERACTARDQPKCCAAKAERYVEEDGVSAHCEPAALWSNGRRSHPRHKFMRAGEPRPFVLRRIIAVNAIA
jgi:hypothetical protein